MLCFGFIWYYFYLIFFLDGFFKFNLYPLSFFYLNERNLIFLSLPKSPEAQSPVFTLITKSGKDNFSILSNFWWRNITFLLLLLFLRKSWGFWSSSAFYEFFKTDIKNFPRSGDYNSSRFYSVYSAVRTKFP